MNINVMPRQDYERHWCQINPILRDKEFVVSLGYFRNRYKVGDGVTPYRKLNFVKLEKALEDGVIYASSNRTITDMKGNPIMTFIKIILDRRIEWRDENLIEKSSLGENSERIDDKPI